MTRELKRRVREHVLGFMLAKVENFVTRLKIIPMHFKIHHDCDLTAFCVRGIDRVLIRPRGGDWKKILAQRETKWIYMLNTVTLFGINEDNSFAPFL